MKHNKNGEKRVEDVALDSTLMSKSSKIARTTTTKQRIRKWRTPHHMPHTQQKRISATAQTQRHSRAGGGGGGGGHHPPSRKIFTTLIFSTFILLLHICQSPTFAFCPAKCQCLGGDTNSRAYCADAALEDVPIQLNPESRYINLTLNKIRHIEYTLLFYVKLEVLDLSQNVIETLGSKNFESQTELRTLNLSRNSLSSLQKDAFKGLNNLLLLDMSYNRIDTIHPIAMADLSALIELDLTNNNIVSLEDNCFRSMISLEILIFRNNQLLDVPANNLQQLHSLKSLDLSVNLIEFVRNDSFEGLRELMKLTLRGNVISELDLSAFEGLIALKHLDLGDNNLTMVPTQQLSKLSNLTYLSLSGNRFTHLPAVAFLNLFHLRELHLNRLDRLSRIDSRAFVDNTHLQTLQLSNNPLLADIPMRLFQGNPNILEVYMQNNNLQTLYAAQFPVDQLERLNLGDNPLQCNCSLLWLWRLVTGNYDETAGGAQAASNGGANGGGPTITHSSAAAVAALEEPPRHTAAGDDDEPDVAAYVADKVSERNLKLNYNTQQNGGYLKLDIERIGCDIWHDKLRTRRQLATMTESEITCPAHIVTIVCAILTCLVVVLTGASIVFYLRFVKRRRKLLHDRSTLRSGKSIVNVHDRILQHQPLSGNGQNHGHGYAGHNIGTMSNGTGTLGSGGVGGGVGGTSMGGSNLNGIGMYPHHTLQPQMSLHHAPMHAHEYQQTLPQVDKLELERYLTAQAIANEYRALKPWEMPPIKDAGGGICYTDEPEHLYEKFDHYEYPDTQAMTKSKQTTLKSLASNSSSGVGSMNTGNGSIGGGKPHVVYV